MPLQSGSDAVLRAMRRSYRQERYLGIIERVRKAIPHAAITTDVIVGFPGETDADFEQTLHVVRESRFASAFTFQYSKRPGTPAAEMDGQVPKQVVQERYERLVALQEEVSWAENRKLVGTEVELLVAEGEGRKDGSTHRMSGRARDNRLVHFALGEGSVGAQAQDEAPRPRPGDLVTARITYAAPHHLVADGENGGSAVRTLRRLRSGDAWEARSAAKDGKPVIALGMPSVGVPAPLPAAPVCG
jgi:tRNA-2-methylthio-N6-dimethylallyladenosine synthase